MKQFIIYVNILLLLLSSCNTRNNKKESDLGAVLVTAKYCYNVYPESCFNDTLGVNIYFAGTIENNALDTIYIPYMPYKNFKPYINVYGDTIYPPNKDSIIIYGPSDSLEESFFYSLINGDTLFFLSYYPDAVIKPSRYVRINLQRHIKPNETKWIRIFKDIDKNQLILDTMKIRYLTPDVKLDKPKKILPPIVFERSTKFRIDTAEYNSYFEYIFKMREYYDDPPKEYLDD